MTISKHVLISLEERHANNILSGTKQVELRRRTMHVEPGSTVWFYVKKPVGGVVGCATVGEIYAAAPSTVWRKYGAVSGLGKAEFMDYFQGLTVASALVIENPKQLKRQVSLDDLKASSPGFHPPQFYCRLDAASPLRKLLVSKEKSAPAPE